LPVAHYTSPTTSGVGSWNSFYENAYCNAESFLWYCRNARSYALGVMIREARISLLVLSETTKPGTSGSRIGGSRFRAFTVVVVLVVLVILLLLQTINRGFPCHGSSSQ
jgi:hypothetical protein